MTIDRRVGAAVALAGLLGIARVAAPGSAGAATTLHPEPVAPGETLWCVLPAILHALPEADAETLGLFRPGDSVKATGREAAGAGGWVETAQGGWIARARVDRVPAPLDGDLPVGREGMVTGRVLPDEWVPSDLVPIPDSLKTAGYEGRTMRLRRGARDAFARMMAAAAADGITLRIFSAWRSAEFQRRLYERAVDRDPAQVSTAAPGRSEHRLGTTVDVSTPGARHLHPELAETPAGRWIARRATEFGIVVSFSRERHAARGMSREPWHLRWVDSAVTDDTAW